MTGAAVKAAIGAGEGGLRALLRCRRGDVLMEYVLLTVLIIVPLVGGFTYIFDFSGKPPMFSPEGALSGKDFGVVGNSFVQLYRMVMSGVSLPLP